MNPDTGAILALANWPRVNANDPARCAGRPPTTDQAVQLNYEPGSTFKAITVAGALQDGLVTPNTEFNIPPVLQVADRQIHDAEAHGYETLTVAEILKVSSNIGADLIGAKLGATRFNYWVQPVRLRLADRRRPAGRGAGHHPAAVASTRAPRWATCRSGRASR